MEFIRLTHASRNAPTRLNKEAILYYLPDDRGGTSIVLTSGTLHVKESAQAVDKLLGITPTASAAH